MSIDIAILIEPGETGLFYATSPELPGLFVSGETWAELEAALPFVIEAIREAERTVHASGTPDENFSPKNVTRIRRKE